MKWLIACVAAAVTGFSANAQCYDQLGRPRVCPNTPRQFGVVNVNRSSNSSFAAVREEIRVSPRASEGQAAPVIAIDFRGVVESPEEIWIRGVLWRRIR